MPETLDPTLAAARARIAAVRPAAYARTRNSIDGAVSGLSPYITHGFVTLFDVLGGVAARHALDMQHRFVFELGWRAYFRHVWRHRGEAILSSLHEGPLPDDAYARELPADIRQACTGVPVVDEAVRALYATGTLHNHARMWLASYVVHVRKVHWRCGADWLYGHLLDGDIASNHLSWQWVAGTGSRKPYLTRKRRAAPSFLDSRGGRAGRSPALGELFNADNVARYAPASWHSAGSVIDTSYDELDRLARDPARCSRVEPVPGLAPAPPIEPPLGTEPPEELGLTAPDAAAAAGHHVWLVHPWSLGELPVTLPSDTVVIGLVVADFHRTWPWSDRRWRFVGRRMAELAQRRWHGDAVAIGAALKGARSVRSFCEPHLAPWLARWSECEAAPALSTAVDGPCESFSQWWARASRGLHSAADLLAVNEVPAL